MNIASSISDNTKSSSIQLTMWIFSVILSVFLVSFALGRPQQSNDAAPTPIPIISQSDTDNGDGSFNFGYETGNGIKYEESGFLKPNPDPNAKAGEESIQVLSGSYSYIAPDGTQINLQFVADENGFQPTGDHLPTPPPIPEEIQKSLNLAAQNDQNAPAQN